jgi:hypothetical protein
MPNSRGCGSTFLRPFPNPSESWTGEEGDLLAVWDLELRKFLVVVYREVEIDGFIITVFITRRTSS